MKRIMAEKVFSLLLMALAAAFYWQTLALPKSRTGLITGPAFFPQWLAVLFFFCSAIPLFKAFTQSREDAQNEVVTTFAVFKNQVLYFVFVILTLLIIPYSGWFPAQFLLVFTMELIFAKQKWTKALFISVVSVSVIYIIFVLGLHITLPLGIFE